MKNKTSLTARQLVLALFFLLMCVQVCLAQESGIQGPGSPSIELLTMNGVQPNLTADGQGMISYKALHLYKRGSTRVKWLDDFKFELPAGYKLFNNLAYLVETDAVFSGPNEVVFRVPSATTNESFKQLRILYAERDNVDPEKPSWVDVTLMASVRNDWEPYLSKADFDERLPDFKKRTLHAFLSGTPAVFVVASKDLTVSRDAFVADLRLKASAPESVMEGREMEYSFEITNDGPDPATEVSFSTYLVPEFVSLNQSQGKCRFEAQNIYCNLGKLEKGAKATITYRGKLPWNSYVADAPVQAGAPAAPAVDSAEVDLNNENNRALLSTSIEKDPNHPPEVVIVKPLAKEVLVGPQVTVNIVAKAHDKDGSVSKVEFFDQGRLIGIGMLTSDNTFKLAYQNVELGNHRLHSVATDNQGRPQHSADTHFLVNGPAQIQITEPKPTSVVTPSDNPFLVSIRASHPKGSIKKIVVSFTEHYGSSREQEAEHVGKDEYTATFKNLSWGCQEICQVVAVATDDAGVETTSNVVEFRVSRAPKIMLSVTSANGTPNGADLEFESDVPITLSAGTPRKSRIVKIDFFANDTLIGTETTVADFSKLTSLGLFHLVWKPKPGAYTVTALAVDEAGEVGKSNSVRIIVKGPQR